MKIVQDSFNDIQQSSTMNVRDAIMAWSNGFIHASKEMQAAKKQQPKPQLKLEPPPPVDDGMEILVDYLKNNEEPQFRDYLDAIIEKKPEWDAINRKNEEARRASMEMQQGYIGARAAVNGFWNEIKKSDEAIKRRRRFTLHSNH